MKKLSILSIFLCIFALSSLTTDSLAQGEYRGTGSGYNHGRPMNTGSNPFYFTRQRKAITFGKEDCEYQIKLCLDEFCYDEFDGYKNCRDNNIQDFNSVVEDCFQGMKSSSIKSSYQTGCRQYVATAVNSYLKQMKQFLNYQTTMAECDNAKDRLRAAQSCYGIAMSMGENSFNKALKDTLATACGPTVKGGSATMVEEFFNAGYMGTDGAGWLANFGMLNFTSKKNNWEKVVDAIMGRYIDMKNAECGEGDYTVGQQGVATSGLSSQGDALRAGAIVAIAGAVDNNQQKKQQAKSAGFITIVLDETVGIGGVADVLRNYSSYKSITPAGNAAKIMEYLQPQANLLRNGSYIGFKDASECNVWKIINVQSGILSQVIKNSKEEKTLKDNSPAVKGFLEATCTGR